MGKQLYSIAIDTRNINPIAFAPVLAAAGYPFLLKLFHAFIGSPGVSLSWSNILNVAITVICIIAVPIIGLMVAYRPTIQVNMRRLAYASIVSPTLYVFLGVLQTLLSSPIPDEWVWFAIWSSAILWALFSAQQKTSQEPLSGIKHWRIAHGVSAAALCIFVLFHVGNHLTGLLGHEMHSAVMHIGRSIYRAPLIEPMLVILMLFQIGSGLYLAWRWSAKTHDFYRTFQIASGVYLSVFILGHMNSVFIYARTYLGIPTDWNFAIGAPTGLIYDPWNIRLLPHYALGVFFVLSHIVSGLRIILHAHGIKQRHSNQFWLAGIVVSGVIAALIIAGMCGIRI